VRLAVASEDRPGLVRAARPAGQLPASSERLARAHSALAAWAATLVLSLVAGCKPVGPNYNRPAYTAPNSYKEVGASIVTVPPPSPPGGGWQSANPSDGMLRGQWWEIYRDPELDQLEDRIVSANMTLRAALESYLAARDQVAVARANFFPTLSAGGSMSRDRVSSNRPLAVSGAQTTYGDFVLSGQASWAPDFWGRIRRTVEQARASAEASAADMATLDLSLHAELAQDYFELRGLDSQSRLLASTVADYEHQLDLNQRLVHGGLTTEVSVAEAQTQLETTRAQLVDVNEARAEYEHAIATLINQEAGGVSLPSSPLDLALPQIPLGVPSQLIERRPDIAGAERRVAAANAQIGIAVSAFYPSINLGGSGGFESTSAGTWIQGPSSLWSLGAQASELLFDAGQRHALTDQARHSYESLTDTYRATVLGAFNEVEDKLSDLRVLEQESEVQRRAVAAAQHSLDLSNQRFRGGATSYLEVLVAESTLLANQRTDTDLVTRKFAASVQLILALGGGWDVTQLPK
jgi:NodT family efflux transporter outer membrane factor (OMF) lipoprotein